MLDISLGNETGLWSRIGDIIPWIWYEGMKDLRRFDIHEEALIFILYGSVRDSSIRIRRAVQIHEAATIFHDSGFFEELYRSWR